MAIINFNKITLERGKWKAVAPENTSGTISASYPGVAEIRICPTNEDITEDIQDVNTARELDIEKSLRLDNYIGITGVAGIRYYATVLRVNKAIISFTP